MSIEDEPALLLYWTNRLNPYSIESKESEFKPKNFIKIGIVIPKIKIEMKINFNLLDFEVLELIKK
ncbi:hypothetical protein GCM10023330_05720 [Litoribaculum gwangyangense]|uniref:Uncharacterized protein n=1 Tax=Litoribaculum gwangyangense TaxID=1130722 RepID=A0ABP9BYP3_9FLAO